MLKNKDNYLSAQIVLEFVDYFAELIDGKPFHHQYHFRKPRLYEGFEKKHQVTNFPSSVSVLNRRQPDARKMIFLNLDHEFFIFFQIYGAKRLN